MSTSLRKPLLGILVLLVTLTLCLVSMIPMDTSYEEFSPHLMATCEVEVEVIPLLGLPTRVHNVHPPTRSRLMQWLVDQGYAVVPTEGGYGWVATEFGVPKKGAQEDLVQLMRELRDDSWIAWSEQNPENSAQLWTTFVRKVRSPRIDGYQDAQQFLVRAHTLRDEPVVFSKWLSSSSEGVQ